MGAKALKVRVEKPTLSKLIATSTLQFVPGEEQLLKSLDWTWMSLRSGEIMERSRLLRLP